MASYRLLARVLFLPLRPRHAGRRRVFATMTGEPMPTDTLEIAGPAETELRALNAGYVAAFMNEDAAWYDAHLTDDFICIDTDGSVIDRAAFLAATKPGSSALQYDLSEVAIRVHGDSGYVTALGSWRRRDGSTGQTRYIDSYVKAGDGWKAVSAQLTRVSGG
jgi:ketosteroid isomerase-like protein